MTISKTKQTYDVHYSKKGGFARREHSIKDARASARFFATESSHSIVYKNPKILSDGTIRPQFQLIEATSVMFIRPTYEFRYFGKEAILENDRPTGRYKYYQIGKDGSIIMTSDSFKKYFDPKYVSSGVWEKPRR